MKNVLLSLVFLCLATPVFATCVGPTPTVCNSYTTNNIYDEGFNNAYGLKADAPKLVQIYNDWYFGVEGGKALNYTDASQGWFVYGKVTYEGTLFSFHQDND